MNEVIAETHTLHGRIMNAIAYAFRSSNAREARAHGRQLCRANELTDDEVIGHAPLRPHPTLVASWDRRYRA